MKKQFFIIITIVILFASQDIFAQKPKWTVGGAFGLSVVSGGGFSSAGLHLGPMIEANFSKQFAVGTEFNINTQAGTPIEWSNYFKYYIKVRGSKITPYVNGGFNLWFYTGGPYFGLRFGGGANFPINKKISIPAEVQLGPVFATGTTPFYIVFRSGIRYAL